MNLSKFLLILQARYKVVLLIMALTMATALGIALTQTKTYKATTSLVLNYKGTDPISGATLPAQLMPGYMATQLDIINSKSVALEAVRQLKLAESPDVQKEFHKATGGEGSMGHWLADSLRRKLDVEPARESGVLNISFKDGDAAFAAEAANAFATAYQQISVQLKVDLLKKASNYFDEQTKALHDKFEQAQMRYSKYQQDKGILNVDGRLDVETVRLNDLSNQLVVAQNQLMEATSRKIGAAGSAASESPDVIGNTLIQNLKLEVARAESKFARVSEKVTRAHPEYQAVQAEVNRLRADLNAQTRAMSHSVANNAAILENREAELRSALETQRTKVLDLNRMRDELSVLGKEMDSAQRAYDTATQRFIQTNLDGQSNLSDVAVLSAAIAPQRPSNISPLVSLVLAAILGAMLGLGFAMITEMVDPCLRSSSDLVNALHAPVLGEMNWCTPKHRHSELSNPLLPRRLLPYFK